MAKRGVTFFDAPHEMTNFKEAMASDKDIVGLSMAKEKELMMLIKHTADGQESKKPSVAAIAEKHRQKKEEIIERER